MEIRELVPGRPIGEARCPLPSPPPLAVAHLPPQTRSTILLAYAHTGQHNKIEALLNEGVNDTESPLDFSSAALSGAIASLAQAGRVKAVERLLLATRRDRVEVDSAAINAVIGMYAKSLDIEKMEEAIALSVYKASAYRDSRAVPLETPGEDGGTTLPRFPQLPDHVLSLAYRNPDSQRGANGSSQPPAAKRRKSATIDGEHYVKRAKARGEKPPPLKEGFEFTYPKGLFKACRKAPYEGQEFGWWCPLPPIGEGETHDYSQNCNHDPFKRGHGLLVHYVREHFDWGVWKGEPRKAGTSGCDSLSCPTCGCCFMTLEEMDKHTIESDKCTPYDLHPVKEMGKAPQEGKEKIRQAAASAAAKQRSIERRMRPLSIMEANGKEEIGVEKESVSKGLEVVEQAKETEES